MDKKINLGDTILITGGGGYLGSRLAIKILKCYDCKVHLVDVNFNQSIIALTHQYENLDCAIIDLTNYEDLAELIHKIRPNHIFHLASIIDRNRDFIIYNKLYEVNVKGTLNLLEALKTVNYSSFNFASTSEVYGDGEDLPFTENSPMIPMSPYSLTKLYSENLIKLHSRLSNKPFKIMRIFNFFGYDMPPTTFMGQMVESFTKQTIFKMTKGEQARDIIPVDDLLNQMLFIAQLSTDIHSINICGGKSFKLIDIVKEFKRSVDNKFEYSIELPYRDNEVWETLGDNSLLSKLGYVFPEYSLELLLKKSATN